MVKDLTMLWTWVLRPLSQSRSFCTIVLLNPTTLLEMTATLSTRHLRLFVGIVVLIMELSFVSLGVFVVFLVLAI